MAPARTRRGRDRDAPAAASLTSAAAPLAGIAHVVPLEPGLYAFGLSEETRWRDSLGGFALPAIHVAASPGANGAIEITDTQGHAASWLGGSHSVLFVKAAASGAALVTGYLARDPETVSLELQVRRLAAPAAGAAAGDVVRLRMRDPAAPEPTRPYPLDIVAHIRGRGDLRFASASWVGRLGPGLWIEAFAVMPRSPAVAAAIEYKGLIAGGGETAWLGGGSLCGTRGRGAPLLGFAVRQKSVPGGALVDCEYAGYFSSGRIAGPVRNGAPCRSPLADDPLEGLHLLVTPRPPRQTAPARE